MAHFNRISGSLRPFWWLTSIVFSGSLRSEYSVKKDNKKIKLFCDANSATPVTIKITGHSGKGLTLSREEIKFTAGNNWTSDEYVTITADPNIAHDEIPLTITAQSGTHGFSGSEIVTVKIDDVDPTPNVEIKDVPPQIGNTGPFTAQFEWNKNVSYFGTEDVTVDGGAKGSWTRISNDVYTLDVTPAGSQDVVVTVLANRAEDGTGRTGPLNDVFETAEWIKIEASPLTQEIKEGQTGTLDVRLSTAPTKTVTVTIVSDKSDLLINPSTLTFEPTDFGDQEVTLTAQSVSSDQKVTLTLTGNNVSDGSAEVTIKNEPQALSVSLSAAPDPVTEGSAVDITAILNQHTSSAIDIPVVITTGTAESGDYTSPNPSSVKITSGQISGKVPITTNDDSEVEGDETFTVKLGLPLPPGVTAGDPSSVEVTIKDNDSASEPDIVAEDVLTVNEGSFAELDVSLTEKPINNVTITISGLQGDLSSDENDLTFTPDTWNTNQSFTLRAAEDADFDDETITLILSASGGSSDVHPVAVTIQDDDELDIIANDVTIQEGGTATLSVGLSTQPSGDVTIQISGYTGTDLGATPPDPSTLTFTTINWETDQDITLSAQHDPDPDDDTETLTLSASGGGYDGVTHDVAVIIQDDDELDIIANDVTIQEGGTATLSVGLSTQPSGDVTIQISGYTGTDLGATPPDPSTLTFTTINWETDQDITLSAQHDPDPDDDTETLTLSASGGGYDGVTHPVAVTIEDDDELDIIPTVSLSAPNTVDEGDAVTITASLSEIPLTSQNIPLNISDPSDGEYTLPNLPVININAGELSGTLDIQTNQDADNENELITVALGNLSSDINPGDPSSVDITIVDDESIAPTVSLSATPLEVVEGGSVTVTATLSSVLPTSVSIGLTEDHITTEPADFDPISSITIPGGELVGTAILTTNDDDIAETDESFLIGLGLLPPEVIYGDTRSVEITILDDGDVPPPSEVSLLVDPQEVKEGDVVTVELHLSQELLIDVVIPLEYTSGTAEDEDYIALDNVTIPAGEKVASGQIMTIQDLDIDDEIFTVALGQLPSDVVGGRETSQTVTILDNFPREASLSANPNPVDEGAPVSITVTLNKPLPDDVIIPLVVTEGTATEQDYETTGLKQIEISTGETTGSYGIDVLQDNLVEDDETFMVSFGTLPTVIIPVDPAEVEVIITDDDMAGINVPSSVSIIEGSTKTFDIALRSIPSDVVTVTLSGYSGTDLTVTPVSIRFMPGSGNQVQQVTLNASEDEDFTNDEVSLILVANGGEYTGITDQVLVTITDNDVPGINALSFLTIEEGSTDALAVSLTQQPLADVTITARSIRGLIEITPASLTLTPNNWNNPHPQAFQLMANEDEDILNDRDEIILSATGGGYDGVEHQLSVTITDDDVPEIIAITEITMDEGGEASFEVRLSAKPWDNVLIDFSGYEGTQLIPQRNMLVFTSLTWNTPQIVKLVASEDDTDFDDNIVNLVLTATGGGYDNVTHTVNITIVDNDRNPDNLSISIYDQQEPESNGTLKLQVELSWRTEETVTVQYKTSDIEAVAGSDYTQSTGIVIFSPGAIRGTIVIDLTHDDTQEDPERFEVTLSNPKNAIIARGTGVGTILDDDGSAYLRIDDALAEEVEGEIKFRIVLSQIQTHMISAVYQTVDGTAKAGKDYVASSGVVTIPPGVTETTITVPLLRDDLDWQEETFTVHLVSSNEAKIAKSIGVATIQKTISVSEEVLEAYTARFVRTVATEVVDALTNRFRSGRIQSACGAGERAEMAEVWSASTSWNPSLGELLSGCQLATSLYNESWNLWGRGGFRRFNGQGVDEITIDGEVTTGMFGLDYRWKPGLLTGVLLVHSEGSGSFEVLEESGEVLAGVTSIYPYASYAGSDWEIWMSAGLGQGNAEVLELEGDLASRFGAMGIQGVLASGQLIRLDYQGDVLLTDARIKEHDVMAEVYRIRAGVEASAKLNEVFHPYISSNVRRDGGSAETGFGLELGGGIRISYPDWALRGEVKTQGLVMHTENSFSEWGMSGSLQIGLEAEGLMMRLRPSWGRRNSMSILSQQTIWNVAAAGPNAHQIEMEIGYGIPWKKGAARSVMGMTRLSQGAMYRLGGELRPLDKFRISVFGITHAQDPGRIGLNVQSTLQY